MRLKAATQPIVAVALFAASLTLCGAQTPTAPDAKAAAKDKAKASAPSIAELQKKIKDQRDTLIADYDALVKQLKDATEAQKKAILDKMEAQKKAFEETSKTLHKQMQEEQRRVRQNAAPGSR